jgi:hypothetical protein
MFMRDGTIEGEGVDDIAPFAIEGRFDCATSMANWTKAYVGMHRVEYFGVYCQGAICGDWSLSGSTGGFWIWPGSVGQSEFAEEQEEFDQRQASRYRSASDEHRGMELVERAFRR